MRILVAEDEQLLADLVAEGLRRLSMAVDVAYDGAVATSGLVQIHATDAPMTKRDHIDLGPCGPQCRQRDYQLDHLEPIGSERRDAPPLQLVH